MLALARLILASALAFAGGAASEASAAQTYSAKAPGTKNYDSLVAKTYWMRCILYRGEAIVLNTSGVTLPLGYTVEVHFRILDRSRPFGYRIETYRNQMAHDLVAGTQFKSWYVPLGALSCTASMKFPQ